MLVKSTGDVKDYTIKAHLDHIQQEGLGNILELDSAPTASEPLIQDGEWGVYSSNLYIRKGSTIHVIAVDSTITVT